MSDNIFLVNFINKENIKEISKKLNEPDWLLERRLKAFDDFLELPFDKDALFYKYTTFRNFDLSTLKPVWTIDESLPNNDNNGFEPNIIENETSMTTKLDQDLVEKGVFLGSFHDFLKNNEKLAQHIITKIQNQINKFDKLGALTVAFSTNTTLLYIPKNVNLENQLVKLVKLRNSNSAMFSEFIGYFGENSNSSFLELLKSSKETKTGKQMYAGINSIYMEDNSTVNFLQIQDWSQNTFHIMTKTAKLENYASYRSLTHLQGGEMTRHNSNIDLSGQGSEGYDLFVKFGNNDQRFDIKSELHHNGRDTIGQVHARTVMMDKSESILRGLMVIPEPGVNADSWLTSHGMTVGKGKITAIPALDIDQNDVKAAHAASVEPISDELIFYLESRGIPSNTSKEMIVKGYFEYVLKLINDDKGVEVSRDHLSSKWEIATH